MTASQSGHIRPVKGRKGFLKFFEFALACRLGIFIRAIAFSILNILNLLCYIITHVNK
jgi:hypothetical protein